MLVPGREGVHTRRSIRAEVARRGVRARRLWILPSKPTSRPGHGDGCLQDSLIAGDNGEWEHIPQLVQHAHGREVCAGDEEGIRLKVAHRLTGQVDYVLPGNLSDLEAITNTQAVDALHGKPVVGALTFSEFQVEIEAALAESETSSP